MDFNTIYINGSCVSSNGFRYIMVVYQKYDKLKGQARQNSDCMYYAEGKP